MLHEKATREHERVVHQFKKDSMKAEQDLLLTAKGHHQGEEHHSPGQQIQAASLISEGPLVGLQGQTYEQVHCAAHHSC